MSKYFLLVVTLGVLFTVASAFKCKVTDPPGFVSASSVPGLNFGGAEISPLILKQVHNGTLADSYLVVTPKGGSTPPHRHLGEEHQYFVSGTGRVKYWLPGADAPVEVIAKPGDFHFLPRNGIHEIENTGDEDWVFIVVLTPTPVTMQAFEKFPTRFDEEGSPPLVLFGDLVKDCPAGYELDSKDEL